MLFNNLMIRRRKQFLLIIMKNKINNSKLEIYIKGFKNFNKSMNDLSNIRGKKNILKIMLSELNTSLPYSSPFSSVKSIVPHALLTDCQIKANQQVEDQSEGAEQEGGLEHSTLITPKGPQPRGQGQRAGIWNKFNSKLAKNESQNINYPTPIRATGPIRIKAGLNKSIINIKNVYTFLENSFKGMSSLISKPIYNITSDKVIIQLFVFNIPFSLAVSSALLHKNKNGLTIMSAPHPILDQPFVQSEGDEGIKNINKFLSINNEKLNIICNILSKYFKKPVELELIQLKYPYYNSNIFVNFLGFIINDIKSRKIFSKLFKKAIIINPTKNIKKIRFSILPALLSGMKIKIAGRIMTNRIIPRKTINIFNRGALARNKVIFLDTARFTNKNKRGAYSITISTGQIRTKI